jgi:hypothetical protein
MRQLGLLAIALACAIGCGGGGGMADIDARTSHDGPPGDAAAAPTAADLLAKLATCTKVGGDYATDSGGPATISICGRTGAVSWKADLDVDCDGKQSAQCNLTADPAYQNQTSATDSHGDPLDAAALPYVVVPLPSSRFDYAAAGLELGSVIAVIYQDRLEYGVFGDEGPAGIIGEASYAMASALGIDPDPSTGGTDSGVAYVAFTGPAAVVAPIEDHAAATQLGITRVRALLAGP